MRQECWVESESLNLLPRERSLQMALYHLCHAGPSSCRAEEWVDPCHQNGIQRFLALGQHREGPTHGEAVLDQWAQPRNLLSPLGRDGCEVRPKAIRQFFGALQPWNRLMDMSWKHHVCLLFVFSFVDYISRLGAGEKF